MTRSVRARAALTVAALTAVLALAGCSGEPLPRDAGSGSGDGYGVPQK
ncbi:MAG: hypothetical protein LH468_11985 [Nocardioides sp.]|nr:hypothetical protein [Nocardioides sp.]